jgi:hypothetical protein
MNRATFYSYYYFLWIYARNFYLSIDIVVIGLDLVRESAGLLGRKLVEETIEYSVDTPDRHRNAGCCD